MIDPNSKMMPSEAPPSVLPSKEDSNVQHPIYSIKGDKSVSRSPVIKICLYKYTYIWQTNDKSYWSYLTAVNKRYAYGFRWIDCCWISFKVRISDIESFICY